MSEVEITLKADTLSATREIAGFRKEYADLVRAIQKPIAQIDAFEKTKEAAKKASAEFYSAKASVAQLKEAIKQAGQPVKELDRELVKAERTLAKTTQEFERQKTRVREQRTELRQAGIDTRNLATEQQRLQAALSGAIGKGKADAHISKTLDQFGITKLRDLRAQLVALQADYKRLTQSGVLSATERMAAEIQYKARVQETRKAIQELNSEQSSDSGIGAITARLTGLIAAAYSVQRAAGFFFTVADEVNTLEDRLRNVLPVYEEYIRTQERLENISDRVRMPIAQTSELFLGMIGPMREAGYSVSSVTQLVGALSAALVSNNVKGEQAAAVLNQLSLGMQTGVIRGDAFNAVLTRLPSVVDALTSSLGVSRAELISMANSGKLTTDIFVKAVSGNFENIMSLADNMRSTVGDAEGTVTNKIGKVVAAIDKITGASNNAVKELDKLSEVLDDAAGGNVKPLFEMLWESRPNARLAKAWKHFFGEVEEAQEEATESHQEFVTDSEKLENIHLEAKRAYAKKFMDIHEQLNIDFKKALEDQVTAQNKAKSALAKAQNEQLATQKRYKDALAKLGAGVTGPASFGNAMRLRDGAQAALNSGDIERAKKLAQEALKMLGDLAEAGENTYGFEGFILGLQAIEEAADKVSLKKAKKEFEDAREKTRLWKEELKKIEDFKISPDIDDESLARATEKLKKWSTTIGKEISVEPRLLPSLDVASAGLPKDSGVEVNALLKPIGITPNADAIEAAVELDKQSLAGVEAHLKSVADLWRKILTVPVTVTNGVVSGPDSIPGYAVGTRSAPPGMAWVGERGPELVRFKGGEQVFTANQSKRMMADFMAPPLPQLPSTSVSSNEASLANFGSVDLNVGGQSFKVYAERSVADELRFQARKWGRTHR